MTTLGGFKASYIFHFTAALGLCTMLLCYILAVSFKHVHPWLPMISGCAVYSPEKFFFRYGILPTALLMGCESVVIYLAAVPRAKAALVLGVLSSLCLSIVAVDSENEASRVHSVSAVAVFILYWGNMVVLSTASLSKVFSCCGYSKARAPSLMDRLVVFLRQFLTCLCGALLVIAAVLSITLSRKDMVVYLALCEWTGTISMMVFSWTFAADTGNIYIEEVRHSGGRFMSTNSSGYHNLDSDSA